MLAQIGVAITVAVVSAVAGAVAAATITVPYADRYADGQRRRREAARESAYRRILKEFRARLRAGDEDGGHDIHVQGSDHLMSEDYERLIETMREEALHLAIAQEIGIKGLANLTAEQVDHVRRQITISVDWPEDPRNLEAPRFWGFLKWW